MRILFLSNYFPGDLGPLARQLAAAPGNEVLFASCRQRRDYALEGVRQVRLKNLPLFGDAPPSVSHLWEEAVKRGDNGFSSLLSLRQTWGEPDMVFASLAGGAAFFTPQVFPESFLVAYAETGQKNFSILPEELSRAWGLIQSTLLLQGNLCFAFSERQRLLFPWPLRKNIQVLPYCVDTQVFSREAARPWFDVDAPGAEPGQVAGGADTIGPLLTLDATGLEEKRLTTPLRIGHAVLQSLPHSRVVMLTENGRLRQALENAAATWPSDSRRRFAAYNALSFERYRDLLAASQLMVRLGDDDAERPLLECMSCETLLMASADAAHFLRPGVNMLELPSHDPVGAVLAQLKACRRDGDASPAPQARMARRNVLTHFSEEAVVPAHLAEVMQAYSAWKKERGRA